MIENRHKILRQIRTSKIDYKTRLTNTPPYANLAELTLNTPDKYSALRRLTRPGGGRIFPGDFCSSPILPCRRIQLLECIEKEIW